jgi:hypothetical protein
VALEPGRELVAPVRAAVSVLDPVRRWAQPLDPAPMPRSALVPMLPLVLARMLQPVRVRVLRQPPGLSLASRPEKAGLPAMAPAMGQVTRGLGPKTELVSDQGPKPAALWVSVPATEPATRQQARRTAPASEPLHSVSPDISRAEAAAAVRLRRIGA